MQLIYPHTNNLRSLLVGVQFWICTTKSLNIDTKWSINNLGFLEGLHNGSDQIYYRKSRHFNYKLNIFFHCTPVNTAFAWMVLNRQPNSTMKPPIIRLWSTERIVRPPSYHAFNASPIAAIITYRPSTERPFATWIGHQIFIKRSQ